ncbi:hypothetical protein FSP39_010527 [Pinctada imbricata]|uniref:Ubiquitin carboxyl-terminal hydrolase MINDY n=1 Tax=Pinctada imbricata TaxID=66713 RepID=A0AA89CBR6_PINIB|nr:hypothetical protein FSP39_010527 [Pinctada imbricata]
MFKVGFSFNREFCRTAAVQIGALKSMVVLENTDAVFAEKDGKMKMLSSAAFVAEEKLIREAKELIWGSVVNEEIFCRWTQGFTFSEYQATALVQYEGGPCAVIAPVQAYFLQNLLFNLDIEDLSTIPEEQCNEALLQSLGDILIDVNSTGKFFVVSLQDTIISDAKNSEKCTNSSKFPSLIKNAEKEGEIIETNAENSQENTTSSQTEQPVSNTQGSRPTSAHREKTSSPRSKDEDQETEEDTEHRAKRQRPENDVFHSRLKCTECDSVESMRNTMKAIGKLYTDSYGVILFMYSVILSKGVEQIRNEMEDAGDQLIDHIHGHGSQSLINLFLCGKAVSNIWDNDKCVSGLNLYGIPHRCKIGFLTLMEHLRYCEVGWYLKNPSFPIWIIASETHLTVLFSKEKNLVSCENEASNAKVIFQSFDPEGNGFINTACLGDLLSALDLVSEKEYVDIMKTKLDSEDLGIITLTSFMDEFYPGQNKTEQPSTFELLHWNGLSRSSTDGKVMYSRGKATVPEEMELQIITDLSPMIMCLRTKWPTMELQWENERIPSLN